MADDMDVGLVILHDLVGIERLLGEADGVNLPADTTDFTAILATIGVRIGPIDGRISGPLGVGGISIGNPVAVVGVVAFDGGNAECFRVPFVGILGSGLEPEAGRGKSSQKRRAASSRKSSVSMMGARSRRSSL